MLKTGLSEEISAELGGIRNRFPDEDGYSQRISGRGFQEYEKKKGWAYSTEAYSVSGGVDVVGKSMIPGWKEQQ